MESTAPLKPLQTLLERRLTIIGDKTLRESNPALQLAQLREVSESITAWHTAHKAQIPARLNHFITQASFEKALAYVTESAG